MSAIFYHTPIMLEECLQGLNINPNGVYVDCTFGGGGHSKAIFDRLGKNGKLFSFDQDESAKSNVWGGADERFIFVPHNFCYLKNFLKLNGITKVDGILADLGVSSHQIDTPNRGFSIRYEDDLLDMRMDRRQDFSALDVINFYQKDKLADVLFYYGELTNSRYIAESIVEFRKKKKIENLRILKEAIGRHIKGHELRFLIKFFQAIRIEVNAELNNLNTMLLHSKDILKVGGRLVLLTFHSLEDRIVKRFMKNELFEEGDCHFNMLTKKPLVATATEMKINKRSTSAKLRVAERI